MASTRFRLPAGLAGGTSSSVVTLCSGLPSYLGHGLSNTCFTAGHPLCDVGQTLVMVLGSGLGSISLVEIAAHAISFKSIENFEDLGVLPLPSFTLFSRMIDHLKCTVLDIHLK